MRDFAGRDKELQGLDIIFQKERICIVNGRPGIGKTYLIQQYIELKECEGSECLYVHDRELNDFQEYRRRKISFLVVDDIDDINKFLVKKLDLKQIAAQKVILITRNNVNTNLNYPVLTVGSMPSHELKKLIHVLSLELGLKISDIEEQKIKFISEGNPLIIRLILGLHKNNQYSLNEIINAFLDSKFKIFVSHFLKGYEELPVLSQEEYDLLLILLTLEDIDISLLLRWTGTTFNEEIIHSLIAKGVVSLIDGHVLAQTSLIGAFDNINVNYDKFYSIAQNMKKDILDNKKVEERYPLAIIRRIRRVDSAVDFVATFYENQYKERNSSIDEDLKLVLKELGYVHSKVDKIDETTENTSGKIEKIIDIQDKIYKIITQLSEEYQDNTEAMNNISELLDIARNPSNYNMERVSSIISFLGSMASIASLFGVQVNLAHLQTLFSSLM